MNVFVTGASGFIGGATVTHLLSLRNDAAGPHIVSGMARSVRSAEVVRALGATPVRCSLADVCAEHLSGVDVVVHCAAHVEQWGARAEFWRVNVAGTQRMLTAAREAGARRFIHIGTEAALFHGQDMRDIDEDYPYPTQHRFLYSETKAEAERRVLAANVSGVFETLSLRPRLVWGPGDQTVLPELTAKVRSGQFAWIDDGKMRTSTTHIDNLVHAIALTLHKGRGGEAYFITDDEVHEFREFASRMLATQRVTPGDRSLPGWAARALGTASEAVWRALRRGDTPPLTRFAANIMSRDCTIRIDKARRELGYEPRTSVERGLQTLPPQAVDG